MFNAQEQKHQVIDNKHEKKTLRRLLQWYCFLSVKVGRFCTECVLKVCGIRAINASHFRLDEKFLEHLALSIHIMHWIRHYIFLSEKNGPARWEIIRFLSNCIWLTKLYSLNRRKNWSIHDYPDAETTAVSATSSIEPLNFTSLVSALVSRLSTHFSRPTSVVPRILYLFSVKYTRCPRKMLHTLNC